MILVHDSSKLAPRDRVDALRLELSQVEIALNSKTDLALSMHRQLIRREKRLIDAIYRMGAKPALAQY